MHAADLASFDRPCLGRCLQCWPAPLPLRRRASGLALTGLKAVDYEAELWRSGSLNTPDAELDEWCEKWARRAIIGEGAGGASVKLTTPVKLARRDGGARLLFTKSGSGYADKDKAKDDKWKDDDDEAAGTAEGGHRRGRRLRGLRRHRRDALRLRGGRYREADERGEDRLAAAEGRGRGVRVRTPPKARDDLAAAGRGRPPSRRREVRLQTRH